MSTKVEPVDGPESLHMKEKRIASAKMKWQDPHNVRKTITHLMGIDRKPGIDLLVEDKHHANHGHEPVWYMIHPNNPVRRAWDVVTILFVLYLCWKIPFSLGFEFWTGNKDLKPFELFMDIWFALDIILNFTTGFIHDGHLHMSLKDSASHYFEFWFWVDIFATIPFELFLANTTKATRKSVKMVKWFKIPRLLRVGRILKQLKGYARFYKVFLAIALLIWCVHFMGCIWMSIITPCGDDYYDYNKVGHCSNVWSLYAVSLDHGIGAVLGTSTTLYRDDHEWVSERLQGLQVPLLHLFHFGASILGILNIAWIFGECATILGNSDPYGWEYFGRLDRIKSEMALHHVPHQLCDEINAYYNYMYMNNRHGATQLLCDPDMSESLRKKISIYMYREVLLHCSFFKSASKRCLEMACERLKFEVHLPKTVLISAGDASGVRGISQMYIVGRGSLNVVQGKPHNDDTKNIVISTINVGECFGEMALLYPQQPRNSTVVAVTIIEVYSLSNEDFKDLLVGFPAFAAEMKAISKQRNENLNRLISLPADSEEGIFRNLNNIAQGKDDDPLEARLSELQAGITNIMHHIRAIHRAR